MRNRMLYRGWLGLISTIGLLLTIWSFSQIATGDQRLSFLMLLAAALMAERAATTVAISSKTGVTYEVGTAICLATLPLYGPAATIAAVSATACALWILTPQDPVTWKRSWSQLGYNVGMQSMAAAAASIGFTLIAGWLPLDTVAAQFAPWLVAALLYDQGNLWLLIVILRLQHGESFPPLGFWRQNWWPALTNILLVSLGGSLVAWTVVQWGEPGLLLLIVPILSGVYAFHQYGQQMSAAPHA